MRLPTVCSRHVLANADADWLCPITFIPVSLFLIYAVADCVLPTCRVWCGCWFMHPSAFFPVFDVFFRLFLHVFVLPSSSSLYKISFGGSETCDLFTNMLLLLFRSLSITPFMWGSSRWSTLSGWSPSNGQNQLQLFWQTWHPCCQVRPFSQPNCPWLCPLSLVLWVLYLLS